MSRHPVLWSAAAVCLVLGATGPAQAILDGRNIDRIRAAGYAAALDVIVVERVEEDWMMGAPLCNAIAVEALGPDGSPLARVEWSHNWEPKLERKELDPAGIAAREGLTAQLDWVEAQIAERAIASSRDQPPLETCQGWLDQIAALDHLGARPLTDAPGDGIRILRTPDRLVFYRAAARERPAAILAERPRTSAVWCHYFDDRVLDDFDWEKDRFPPGAPPQPAPRNPEAHSDFIACDPVWTTSWPDRLLAVPDGPRYLVLHDEQAGEAHESHAIVGYYSSVAEGLVRLPAGETGMPGKSLTSYASALPDTPTAEALLHRTRKVDDEALAALDEGQRQETVACLMRAAADDPDSRVRSRALTGLGRLKDPASFDVVLAALDDADGGVVLSAVYALGELGNPAAEARLKQMWVSPPPQLPWYGGDTVYKALHALTGDDPAKVQALERWLEEERRKELEARKNR